MLPYLAIVSLVLHLVNAALTLRLMVVTGRRLPWTLLAGGIAIIAVRRFVLLFEQPAGETLPASSMGESFVIASSLLIMAGLILIRPLLESIRAAERTMQSSDEQYRSLSEFSPLPIVVCRDERIEYANRSAMAILGVDSQDQVLKRPAVEFVEPHFRALVSEGLRSLSEESPSRPLAEIQIQRADGGVVDVEVLFALYIFGGSLSQFMLMWDVSQRNQREEMLRDREAELAHVMRRHTMGEIAAEMAHEINQPLYAISNFAQAGLMHLQSGDPQRMAQLKTCLEHAHTQAARAAQIVKNLRNFVSKSEDAFREVSFHQLVRDALDLVTVEARRKHVQVELAMDCPSTTIRVDPVQIQQVLVNLLVNAFEAMEHIPKESRRARVAARSSPTEVEVTVEDSGPGMADDQLARLFEPFFTTKAHGMGMGLPVSRTIILNHGGKLWAERNLLGGTTFHVVLPLDGSESLANALRSPLMEG